MIDYIVLGRNIRAERKKQSMTQEQLAEKAGITENYLGKIERAETTPSLETTVSIAAALGVTVDQLLYGAEQSPEHQLIASMMMLNGLDEVEKRRFMDFLSANVRFFKK